MTNRHTSVERFLSRWSRRKRSASIPPPQGEGGEDQGSEPGGGDHSQTELAQATPTPDPSPPRASRAGGGEPHRSAPQEAEFDPANLPPIESIDAGTDVSAFLRPGVPADLAQAALRRAWVADPAIRDFVGPAENAWDFNAPGGVPGFGPLHAIDDVQRLAAQVAGMLPAATEKAGVVAEAQNATEPKQAVAQPVRSPEVTEPPAPPARDAAMQKDGPAHDS